MPILDDILDHPVLGREFKRGLQQGLQEGLQEGEKRGLIRGETTILRRLILKRFGKLPKWAEKELAQRTAAELEELSVRILDASSLKDLLGR